MSNVSVQPTDPLRELAAAFTRRFDTDRDGRLSTDEFAAALQQLLGGTALGQQALGRALTSASTSPVTQAWSAAPLPLVSGAPYTGFSPRYPFEGFDFVREQNPGKSAKDAFAMLANQAPPPPFLDKPAIGDWFNTHIRPGMNQLGHSIGHVIGDKFTFSNWQGSFEVDFVRGAGAPGAALAWQVL